MSWVYRRPHDYRAKRPTFYLLLAAASATAGTSDMAFAATGELTGAGAMEGSCSLGFSNSAELAGSSSIAGSTAIVTDVSGTLNASGALVGTASLQFTLSATGQTSAAFNPLFFQRSRAWHIRDYDYSYHTNRLVIFPLSAPSNMAGQADMVLGGAGVLTGAAALSGSGALTLTASGTLAGGGTLEGSSTLSFALEGDLSGTTAGDIAGASDITVTLTAALNGNGALVGASSLQFTASADLSQVVSIQGSSEMAFSLSGVLSDGSVPIPGQARQRFEASREQRIFRAKLNG